MILFTLLLLAHLVGAVAALVIVMATWLAIYKTLRSRYRKLAIGLATATGWQLVSGALLSLASAQQSGHVMPVLTYCRNLGVYVIIMTVTQIGLYRAMQSSTSPFPGRLTLATALAGFAVALIVGLAMYA